MRRRSKRNDAGSALIMALLIVSMLGIILTAALPYARTSAVASSQAFTPARTGRDDAESAIQAAVRYVEQSQQNGNVFGKDIGRPCPPNPGADLNEIFTYAGKSGAVTVDICPQVDSFNLNGNARAVLLTLAPTTAVEDGVTQTKNNSITVSGDVFSNSDINVRGLTVVGGQVWSWNDAPLGGDCASGSVTVAAGKDCAASTTYGFTTLSSAVATTGATSIHVASDAKFPQSGSYAIEIDNEKMLVTGGQGTTTWTVAAGDRGMDGTTAATHLNGKTVDFMPENGVDPGDAYLGHASDWLPAGPPGAIQTPSSCTLSPGVYTHGDLLSEMWNNPLNCSTVTLNPGEYYLDFPPDGSATSLSNTDDTWSINGLLQGPNASCASGDPGAQLVLANATQIVNSETIDIPCGAHATSNAPRIAIMGLKTAVGAGSTVTTKLYPTAAADAGGGFFNPLANATKAAKGASTAPPYPQDGSLATAAISQNNKTANLKVSAFAPGSTNAAWNTPLTSNSALDHVVVKVVHSESANINFTSVKPVLNWGTCAVTLAPTPTQSAGVTTYTSNDLASSITGCVGDPSVSPTLTWSVHTTSNAAASINVDGAEIDVTWHDAGVPAQTGCVIHGACNIISSGSPSGHDSFLVNNVVYIPQNSFQTTCKNGCNFDIKGALIAWTLDLDANPASVGTPVIGGTTNIFTTGKVLFQAFIGTTEWTDAYATFDKASFVPTVNSWIDKK